MKSELTQILSLPYIGGHVKRPSNHGDEIVTLQRNVYNHHRHGREIENLGVTVMAVQRPTGDNGLLLHLNV